MMNCLKCQTQNEVNANFCKQCGTNLQTNSKPKREDEIKDALLIIFIIIGFVSVLVNVVVPLLEANLFEFSIVHMQAYFWILNSLSMLLIPFAIKNKNLKIIGIIVSVLCVIYWTNTNIQFLLT